MIIIPIISGPWRRGSRPIWSHIRASTSCWPPMLRSSLRRRPIMSSSLWQRSPCLSLSQLPWWWPGGWAESFFSETFSYFIASFTVESVESRRAGESSRVNLSFMLSKIRISKVKCDPRHGKYMACCMMYRGHLAILALQWRQIPKIVFG